MALDTGNTDPCGLLNTKVYPDLWIDMDVKLPYQKTSFDKIATGRTSTTPALVAFAAPSNTGNVVVTTSSSARLIKFMSEGKTFDQCSLKVGTAFKTILGDYSGSSTYINSDGTGPVLNVTNVYNALVNAGHLLTTAEVYKSTDFTATPSAGTESLMYLYNLRQQGTSLTSTQTQRVTLLEEKNLKFFAAFLMEYCYYRTRYQYMLRTFFDLYKGIFTSSNLTNYGINTEGVVKILAMLNTKLTDMRRLLAEINQQYTTITSTIRQQINTSGVAGSTQDLQASIVALRNSATKAKEYKTEADFKRAAMEYAAEKNRYANIQLGLYAILNIAALAMIFKLK